jgi:hypothetical protein
MFKIIFKQNFKEHVIEDELVKMLMLFQLEIRNIGWDATNKVTQFIQQSIKRPGSTGNLYRAINCYEFGGAGTGMQGFGIGKISELNQKAPYWYVLNYGMTTSGNIFIPGMGKKAPVGTFIPGLPMPDPSSFRDGRWTPGAWSHSGKSYTFVASRWIQPLNYIEFLEAYVEGRINQIMKQAGNVRG